MKKANKLISVISTITVCFSILSVSATAATTNETRITSSNEPHDVEIIATYEPISRAASNVTFDHSYGVNFKTVGSNAYKEQAWGKTHHYIKKYNASNQMVDGYTRARWELSGKIKADSGRCWDHDDGYIDGMSEAKSGWVLENTFYVAHTYYGN